MVITASFFFFNDTATTEIYTLSLHDALPISAACHAPRSAAPGSRPPAPALARAAPAGRERWRGRSEEHTSELQSQSNLVCRLLLEKKNVVRSVRPCAVKLPRCKASPGTGHRS